MASKRMREVMGARLRGDGEEGDGAHVERGVEDVAAVGDERAAEVGIDEDILRDLPTGPLARTGQGSCAGATRRHRRRRASASLGRR